MFSSILQTISIVSTSPIQEQITQEDNQETISDATIVAQIIDPIIDTCKRQLDDIFGTLSMLSTMISENQVPTIANKRDALDAIKSMTYLLQGIQHERFIGADLQSVQFLIDLIESITKHVLTALNNGCHTIEPFDIQAFAKKQEDSAKRSKHTNLDAQMFEQFDQSIKKNTKRIEQLKHKAERAGLRWYNRLYRTLDKYVIAPCDKYSIGRRAWLGLEVACAATYIYWYLSDNDTFKRHMPFAYKLLRDKPEYAHGIGLINREDVGSIIKGEFLWSQILHSNSPLLALLASGIYYKGKQEWNYHVSPYLAEKWASISNRLKGGQYLRQARSAEDMASDVTFDDLIGLDHVKHEFMRIVSYLENPESYDRMGATPPKGILLMGDTRTGKSFSVKALFGEIAHMLKRNKRKDQYKFIELNATWINKKGIAYLLEIIKEDAPCVIFIDEIDLLHLQRGNQDLSEWLTAMSGTIDAKDPKNQVIIIAATNRPETLDKALRQPGRFGRELHFEYPTAQDRKLFILKQLDKLSLNPNLFDVDGLVGETEGKSFEALKLLINTAIIKARSRGQGVGYEHIQESIDEVLHHIIMHDNKDISDEKKALLSAHFAGHALFTHLFDKYSVLSKVTINQVMKNIKEEAIGLHLYDTRDDKEEDNKHFEYGSIFVHHNHDPINVYTQDEKMTLCRYHVAGIVAEEIMFGSCSYSCHNKDMEKALTIAQSITFQGLDVQKFPKHIQKKMHDDAIALVDRCKAEVTEMFKVHRNALQSIAQVLSQRGTIGRFETAMIIDIIENPTALEEKLKEVGISIDALKKEFGLVSSAA